ncbi:hypothetical protein E1176_16000 [Fulvivirga sp. RKSG066]|uniref:hypothetical protein n=1 Tax=Fulvivirga aurantia TaxID=2529383 RepID=UPI0012BC385A|nr:hypothetical protein [Fulvivirga aurantia]MTI22535.1 hypothetical protein [Fulvivirga aurantia]
MHKRAAISYFFITGFFILFAFQSAYAQDEEKVTIPLNHFYAEPTNSGGLRALISKLHFSFSPGYGRTFYSQDLSDFAILQPQNSGPVIFSKDRNISGGNISSAYRYWFNDVVADSSVSFNPASDFLVNSDTADIKYKAPGTSIPLTGSIHVEFDRYKIGGGFIFEYHRPGTFAPNMFEDELSTFDPDFGSTFYKKYFVLLGAKVYRYYEYVLAVDAQIGAFNLTKKFNKDVIQKGIYFNIGATIEREMSEYFSLFVRPSFDFKNFTVNMPETDLSVNTSMNAFYVSFGFIYRIPKLRKCFLKSCTTQINHQHGNKVYRSRVHPFYKWQNPHHGQNYPNLIKYKRKNKKKFNAY